MAHIASSQRAHRKLLTLRQSTRDTYLELSRFLVFAARQSQTRRGSSKYQLEAERWIALAFTPKAILQEVTMSRCLTFLFWTPGGWLLTNQKYICIYICTCGKLSNMPIR